GVPVEAIVTAVRDTLDRTPPELGSDVMDRGMVLAGGGALLRLLDERLRRETGIPVHVADDPLMCVAIGSGRCLEEIEYYRSALSSSS
ncbi:MAG: rod shape-determining protein, partial [Actinomycetota bacterium]|nr:rod shape-determining protein [Actinomycetota bacterium]